MPPIFCWYCGNDCSTIQLHTHLNIAALSTVQSENLYNNQIEAYIQFYNEIRLHQSLKFKTPQAFEGIYREHFVKKKCSNNDLVQILLFSILGVL
jgi:hypothetical protein